MDEIFKAALKNDPLKIMDYLKYGNINILEKDNHDSLLHLAARGNAMEVGNILLANFINPNLKNDQGETPLFEVIRTAKIGFIKLLLRNHADLNVLNNEGDNLLFKAILKGNKEVIDLLLLNNDFNFEHVNLKGESILNFTIKAHNFNLFLKYSKLYPHLLKLRTNEGRNLLEEAIKENNLEVFNYLLDNKIIDPYNNDFNYNNSFFYSALYGNYEIITKLLSLKPLLKGKNKFGEDILKLAKKNPHDISYLFLEYLKTYDYINYELNFPHHLEAIARNFDLVSNLSPYEQEKRDTKGLLVKDYLKYANLKELY